VFFCPLLKNSMREKEIQSNAAIYKGIKQGDEKGGMN
jgi:hypothetical protein